MTDKELRRLNRRELLQLMLNQGREAEELRQKLGETNAQLEELQSNYERLKKRLDQKDIQIRQLTETLQSERTKREIELEEAGSIAEAALRLNGVFEAAQKAAEQYIYNVRLLHDYRQRERGKCLGDTLENELEARHEERIGQSMREQAPGGRGSDELTAESVQRAEQAAGEVRLESRKPARELTENEQLKARQPAEQQTENEQTK